MVKPTINEAQIVKITMLGWAVVHHFQMAGLANRVSRIMFNQHFRMEDDEKPLYFAAILRQTTIF